MKRKHIIAGTSAAIIGGVIVYFLRRRSKHTIDGLQHVQPLASARTGEDKIRRVMHHAKEVANGQ